MFGKLIRASYFFFMISMTAFERLQRLDVDQLAELYVLLHFSDFRADSSAEELFITFNKFRVLRKEFR